MNSSTSHRRAGFAVLVVATVLSGAWSAMLGVCGPFTDVTDATFCPFVLEIFTLGITTGTTPTTYDPASSVNRLQMAAFLSRTVDSVLRRGSRRALLGQFWTPQGTSALTLTSVGTFPVRVRSDGLDLWVSNFNDATVSRVRAASGNLLSSWSGASSPRAILFAMGRVLVTGQSFPGKLYRIDPTAPAGVVTTVASNLGGGPVGLAFDGSRFLTANNASSVSIVTPGATIPWTVTTVTAGFVLLNGAIFDGVDFWVTDATPGALLRLDASGAILQTVSLGGAPQQPVFDGTNLWVPNSTGDFVSLVRASSGTVLKTLTGNGLDNPSSVAFDGERVLTANGQGQSVSLWKAADATPLGSFPVGATPGGVCSDGVNFWITFLELDAIGRF